ncbi:MAG TPA: 30S ribosomal protein S6 [Candidatus Portnoybacteria bacterium]|jgi:ribosomal protein S6|nr:30S ribosomal protein S6 [Candidatus Portnoybacteria bacterium]MDD5752280.1 30S ribosomal protein S6 [Candidatus Portnoybacteria bacterium]HNU96882.1 30S ribosomal protein S6 [Candidatus Portnoybacteria bacterium]HOZ16342.1 30S ribosomal protein S6 [Candidatus Portnoybacteria bacterium]HPH52227.1 30S ribosomal protein S6 [Candidatus Portnoybacteria bacterium]
MENEQKQYELTCILEPHLESADLENFKKNLEKIAINHNGQIKHFMEPEKKELAYPINKQGQAIYIISHLVFESNKVNEFLKELKTNKFVLRHLITVQEEKTSISNTEKPKITRKPAASVKRMQTNPSKSEGSDENDKLNLEEIDKKLDELVGL